MTGSTIEEWRTIAQAPDYQVSGIGRVKRVTVGSGSTYPGKILRPCLTKSGYLRICLRIGGQERFRFVHNLVCRAFWGDPPSEGHQAAHGNGLRTDNRFENIRWATPKENQADRIAHGTRLSGANHPSRNTPAAVRGAAIRASEGSFAEIAAAFSVSESLVRKIKRGGVWEGI